MNKKISIFLLIFIFGISLFHISNAKVVTAEFFSDGGGSSNSDITDDSNCEHDWQEASCQHPRICKKCGKTVGDPLPHHCIRKCEVGFACDNVGEDEECHVYDMINSLYGLAKSPFFQHNFVPATCFHPLKCTICGISTGQCLPHQYVTVDGETYCSVCQSGKRALTGFKNKAFESKVYTPSQHADETSNDSYVIYFGGSGERSKGNYDNSNNANAIFASGALSAEDLGSTVYTVAYDDDPSNGSKHANEYKVILDDICASYMNNHPGATYKDALENVHITSMGYSLGSDDAYFFRRFIQNEKDKLDISSDDTIYIGMDGLGYSAKADLDSRVKANDGEPISEPNMYFLLSTSEKTGKGVIDRANNSQKEGKILANYEIIEEASGKHGQIPPASTDRIIEIITGESTCTDINNPFLQSGDVASSKSDTYFEDDSKEVVSNKTIANTSTTGSTSSTTNTITNTSTTGSTSSTTNTITNTSTTGSTSSVTNTTTDTSSSIEIDENVTWKFVFNNEKEILNSSNNYSASTYAALEKILAKQVEEAGKGTRAAAVATARFLAGLDKAVPYSSGDVEHRYYNKIGLNNKWGTKNYGLDCDGFVKWVLMNAGLSINDRIWGNDNYKLKNYYTKLKVGDLIQYRGYRSLLQPDGSRQMSSNILQTHIEIVIGIDDSKIYIASANGNRLRIKTMYFSDIKNVNNSYSRGSIPFVMPYKDYVQDGNNLTNMWSNDIWSIENGEVVHYIQK